MDTIVLDRCFKDLSYFLDIQLLYWRQKAVHFVGEGFVYLHNGAEFSITNNQKLYSRDSWTIDQRGYALEFCFFEVEGNLCS